MPTQTIDRGNVPGRRGFSVRARLMALSLGFLACFLALLVIHVRFSDERLRLIDREESAEQRDVFERIVFLRGASLRTLISDYTRWTEMVDFIQSRDTAWADENLDVYTLELYGVDSLWVYDTSGAFVYSNHKKGAAAARLPLKAPEIAALFKGASETHFFIPLNNGVLEVRGATIHPSDDTGRATAARGYFFAGMAWDRGYRAKLEALTKASIKVVPPGGVRSAGAQERGAFYKPLPGWRAAPAAFLRVVIPSHQAELVRRVVSRLLLLFVLFGVVSFVLLTAAVSRWVNRPINVLSGALLAQEPVRLARLRESGDEFGALARIMCAFFAQKEKLRQSEEQYRQVLENSNDIIFRISTTGFIQYVSPKAAGLYGYDPSALLGKHFTVTTPLGEVPKVIEALNAVQSGKAVHKLELAQRAASGELIPMEVNVGPVHESGRFAGLIGVMRDITERRKAQEELRRVAVEWQMTFDAIEDMVSIQDADYRLLSVNKAFLNTLGVRFEDVIGRKCHEVIHATSGPVDQCPLSGACTTGNTSVREIFEERLGVYLEVSASPIRDERGKIIRCVHVAKDVTERKKMEDSIRRQSEFLSNILESITQPLYVIDANTYEIVMANSAAGGSRARMTCYALTHRRDTPCAGDHVCPLQKVKETGRPVTVEHIHDDAAGHAKHVEVRAYPLFDAQGSVNQVIEYCVDITERKRSEAVLKEYSAKLAESNKELDDFTYIVSHDLKEPLRSIDAFSKFMLNDYKDKLNEEGIMYLERICANAGRMKGLIDDLLALSRIDRKRNQFEMTDAGEIVKDAVFRLEYAIAEKQAQISIEGKLPVVFIDKVRFTEVFANLISNAVKFTDGRRPVVEIGCVVRGAEYEFYVKDNGPGIEERYYDRIFEIFQRLGKKEEHEGTGAGLTIVKKIVQMHSGKIWLVSKIGEGTTFFFTLPKKTGGGIIEYQSPTSEVKHAA